jgi:hypothetical protein
MTIRSVESPVGVPTTQMLPPLVSGTVPESVCGVISPLAWLAICPVHVA